MGNIKCKMKIGVFLSICWFLCPPEEVNIITQLGSEEFYPPKSQTGMAGCTHFGIRDKSFLILIVWLLVQVAWHWDLVSDAGFLPAGNLKIKLCSLEHGLAELIPPYQAACPLFKGLREPWTCHWKTSPDIGRMLSLKVGVQLGLSCPRALNSGSSCRPLCTKNPTSEKDSPVLGSQHPRIFKRCSAPQLHLGPVNVPFPTCHTLKIKTKQPQTIIYIKHVCGWFGMLPYLKYFTHVACCHLSCT